MSTKKVTKLLKFVILQVLYDRRVCVTFQENAWCDEAVMSSWIRQQWKPVCCDDMMLILDVHKAQKTEQIQKSLRENCKTEPVFVPAGTTSLVQPVDVVYNAPFKAAIDKMATAHLQEHLDDYVKGKVSASERRILFTKWVGRAWEELSAKKDMIIRSFQKCGISVPIDGSEDGKINIIGLEDYEVGASASEDEATDDDDDPFEDVDDADQFEDLDDADPFDDTD